MKTMALIPAVLAAGVIYAAPAHAVPAHPILHWEGGPPTGGLIIGSHAIHAEMNTINGLMHATAANGCDEDWPLTGPQTDIDNVAGGFVDVRVNSGRGSGCQPTGEWPAKMEIFDMGGGNYRMIVYMTEQMVGSDGVASWTLFGHDG
jgi:hypothetical protein